MLLSITAWSSGTGVPLLVSVPSAGAPPSGKLNQIWYCVIPLPVTVKMLESETCWLYATVGLLAVTTGGGTVLPASVMSASTPEGPFQLPLNALSHILSVPGDAEPL